MSKSIAIYLAEEFADWEGALLMPELRQMKRPFKVVSRDGTKVTSIGGLRVEVDDSIENIKADSTEALILIGADTWDNVEKNKRALDLAQEFHQKGILVAAICAATIAVAKRGMLDDKKHTSNDLGMLKKIVPTYRGDKNYIEKLAVQDGNLITASGVGYAEFTYEVLKYLKVFPESKCQQWFDLYKKGVQPPMEFWNYV
jgi:putative intracellular protease/amidase